MGLFSKKKKKNNFDPREQYVPEVTYDDDLTTTLVNAIGIGSKDAKMVAIEYENDTLFYYFDSGVLRGIESAEESLELHQRFYWVDQEKYDEEILGKIAQLSEEKNLLDLYRIVTKSFPDYVELMSDILYNISFQLLLSHYEDKKLSVQLELLDQDEDKKVRELYVMNIDSRNIGVEINKELVKHKELTDLITNSESDVTLFRIEDSDYVPENDLEKIVWAAAESDSTLANIYELSKGFLWSEILETINKMNYSNKISILDPSSIQEEDSAPLPDLDLDLLIDAPVQSELVEKEVAFPELITDEPEADFPEPSVIESDPYEEDAFADPDEWEYSAPEKNESKDDGGFVYEETVDDDITLTKHLLDDFDFNVKVALAEEEFDRDTIVKVSALLRENRSLEEKTAEIDAEISPLQTNYDNRFTNFQHLSVSKTVNDEAIASDEIEQMRELSNRSFRELYDLEEERFNIGVERKEVLQKLEKELINLTNENSQELLYRLNQKVSAIDNVVNLAYHTPSDDEHMEIDPVFLEATELTPEETPMFQKLMQKYGDPFKTLTK